MLSQAKQLDHTCISNPRFEGIRSETGRSGRVRLLNHIFSYDRTHARTLKDECNVAIMMLVLSRRDVIKRGHVCFCLGLGKKRGVTGC